MADLVVLVKEMAMMPVREIPTDQLLQIKDMNEIRPIELKDFQSAMRSVVPSVSKHTIVELENWRKEKG
jgi:SpoVK/Ycf46/Vps4 family AAA+-type ATPase